MKDILWNKIILDEFIRLAMLTEFEEKVLKTQIAGWSRAKQAREFSVAVETVDKALKTIRQKYDTVQPFSPVLPVRKKK